jgi:hypothetical protein
VQWVVKNALSGGITWALVYIEKLPQSVKKKSFLFCKGITDMVDIKSGNSLAF